MCRPNGSGKSLHAVDSRSLRSSTPARGPRCLTVRETARKLRAQGRSGRGITGPDGLPLWAEALVAFQHDVEAARLRVGGERLGLTLVLEAREVSLEPTAGIVAQLDPGEPGRG